MGPLVISEKRSEVVDFMSSFWQDQQTFVIKIPDESKWTVYANLFKVVVTHFILEQFVQDYTCSCS